MFSTMTEIIVVYITSDNGSMQNCHHIYTYDKDFHYESLSHVAYITTTLYRIAFISFKYLLNSTSIRVGFCKNYCYQ